MVIGWKLFYQQFYILLLLVILFYVYFVCLLGSGVKGLYQIYPIIFSKSLYLSDFDRNILITKCIFQQKTKHHIITSNFRD